MVCVCMYVLAIRLGLHAYMCVYERVERMCVLAYVHLWEWTFFPSQGYKRKKCCIFHYYTYMHVSVCLERKKWGGGHFWCSCINLELIADSESFADYLYIGKYFPFAVMVVVCFRLIVLLLFPGWSCVRSGVFSQEWAWFDKRRQEETQYNSNHRGRASPSQIPDACWSVSLCPAVLLPL